MTASVEVVGLVDVPGDAERADQSQRKEDRDPGILLTFGLNDLAPLQKDPVDGEQECEDDRDDAFLEQRADGERGQKGEELPNGKTQYLLRIDHFHG